jgi:uncharacterized protein (TIGR00251 family)
VRRLRSKLAAPSGGTPGHIEIAVRVIPRARKTECTGFQDDVLVVRLAAPPVDGAANDALIEFFASTLHVPRRAVRILRGERSRQKRVAIEGVTRQDMPWSRTSSSTTPPRC